MSRYPFRDYAEALLLSRSGVYAPATYVREQRRLDRMFRDIMHRYELGELSTTSPAKFSEEDIRKYLVWRKGLKYTRTEYSHEIFTLRSICDFAGNAVVHNVLRKYPTLAPAGGHVRLPSLTPAQASASTDAALDLCCTESLRNLRAAALFAAALGGGLRTKELLCLDLSSVDAEGHKFNLIHVKGEDSYGSARSVILAPVYWQIFSSYLRVRLEASTSGPVFITSVGRRISDNCARVDLKRIEKASGVRLDFRILRRSFGQNLIDSGLPVEAVSVLLGHSSTRTTEHYYCRLSNEDALAALTEIYKKNFRKVESWSAGGSRQLCSGQVSGVMMGFLEFFGYSPMEVGTIGV